MKVVAPNYKITRESDEKHKTYLDTFGRPVLVFTAKRLEESHIQNIEVYSDNKPNHQYSLVCRYSVVTCDNLGTGHHKLIVDFGSGTFARNVSFKILEPARNKLFYTGTTQKAFKFSNTCHLISKMT